MEYKTILVEAEDRIATVTINRPEVRNALARETYGEIACAMRELGNRKDVGAIVITGTGKHFSAGGDIKRFKELIDSGTYLDPNQILTADTMATAIRECPKPVIAMINGTATGAGLSCALACDSESWSRAASWSWRLLTWDSVEILGASIISSG